MRYLPPSVVAPPFVVASFIVARRDVGANCGKYEWAAHTSRA
jgi:hypothetical protein